MFILANVSHQKVLINLEKVSQIYIREKENKVAFVIDNGLHITYDLAPEEVQKLEKSIATYNNRFSNQ